MPAPVAAGTPRRFKSGDCTAPSSRVGKITLIHVEAAEALPPGAHQVRMEFAYAGGGLGKGGHVTLYVDGKKAGGGSSQ